MATLWQAIWKLNAELTNDSILMQKSAGVDADLSNSVEY
jgi:hypothetical protein